MKFLIFIPSSLSCLFLKNGEERKKKKIRNSFRSFLWFVMSNDSQLNSFWKKIWLDTYRPAKSEWNCHCLNVRFAQHKTGTAQHLRGAIAKCTPKETDLLFWYRFALVLFQTQSEKCFARRTIGCAEIFGTIWGWLATTIAGLLVALVIWYL